VNPVLLSAKSPHYATPKALYEQLDAEFHFDLDPCPYNEDYSGPLFSFDGLNISWEGRRVYCNPPFGKAITKFMMKAIEAELAVFLVPARVDTAWFHELALPHAKEIRFLRGRLKFENCKNPAPFPCMLVIFTLGEALGSRGRYAERR
jgi:site-specific DNA-methyltransferase (adenine-specific)